MLSYNPKNNARMIVHKRKVFDVQYQKDHSFSKEKVLSQLESLFENQLEYIEDPGDEFENDCKALRWAIEFIKANYPEDQAIERNPIEELKLPKGLENTLKRSGYNFIEDLLDVNPLEINIIIDVVEAVKISKALESWLVNK